MMRQPELPLFVFQILLFRGCQVKVTLFKSPSFKRSSRWKALPSKIPDVRSISAVSRSQLAPLASFIQLHGEAAEVVVDLGVGRPRGGLKVILTWLLDWSLTSQSIELPGTAPKSRGGCFGKLEASGLIFSNLHPKSATREDGSALQRNSVQRP